MSATAASTSSTTASSALSGSGTGPGPVSSTAPTAPAVAPPASDALFLDDGLRGTVRGLLTPAVAMALGRALGGEAQARGHRRLVVARDGRLPSQDLATALMGGLNEAGIDVLDLGLAPIGVMQQQAQAVAEGCGAMVSGGRSPASVNGIKAQLGGRPLTQPQWQALRARMATQDGRHGDGDFEREDRAADWIEAVAKDITVARPMKVVLDHGNGATAVAGAALFRRLGCTVHEIWPQVDGNFPNHFPDPTLPENWVDAVSVQRSSAQGEIAFVFSADGAGLAVIDQRGYPVEPDRVLALLAADLLQREPGAVIVADGRSAPRLAERIAAAGGELRLAPVGQASMAAALRVHGARLAGDQAGHLWFGDRGHGLDDALYAAARIVECLSRLPDAAAVQAALGAALPKAWLQPEWRIGCEDATARSLLAVLADLPPPAGARLEPLEGADGRLQLLRWVWPDGLAVARRLTTRAGLGLRFEGHDAAAGQRAQAAFKALFAQARPGAALPF